MQLFNGLTMDEVVARQTELVRRLRVVVKPYSRENDCYPNCVTKKEKDGGEIVVGWRRDRPNIDGPALVATLHHHAVWKHPGRELIDITPQVLFCEGKMDIVTPNYVDFMIDPTAIFDDPGRSRDSVGIPLASDDFGLLKDACARIDRRARAFEDEDVTIAAYEGKKITELLRAHLRRMDAKRT